MFIPQTHQPGQDAEVDFGNVYVDLGGARTLCYMFVFRLSFSGKAVHRPVDRTIGVSGVAAVA